MGSAQGSCGRSPLGIEEERVDTSEDGLASISSGRCMDLWKGISERRDSDEASVAKDCSRERRVREAMSAENGEVLPTEMGDVRRGSVGSSGEVLYVTSSNLSGFSV